MKNGSADRLALMKVQGGGLWPVKVRTCNS
jgi:hypothetical protein